jgi:hypothetical protein
MPSLPKRKRGAKGTLVANTATLVYTCPNGKRATIVSCRVPVIAAGVISLFVGGSADTDAVSYAYVVNASGSGAPYVPDLATLAFQRQEAVAGNVGASFPGGPITLEATHTVYLKPSVAAGYLLIVLEEDA